VTSRHDDDVIVAPDADENNYYDDDDANEVNVNACLRRSAAATAACSLMRL